MILRSFVTLAALLALAAPAAAGPRQESTFQDDNLLVYPADAGSLRATLDELRRLGVDRLRVTVLWKIVAPEPGSRRKPAEFDASDPADYPPGAWDRYDLLVSEAHRRGLKVNFNVTGPAPLWATEPPPRDDIAETFEPSPLEFDAFVTALGRRYSGDWPSGPYVLPEAKIPRVDYWSIWNEPNQSGWLTPQWSRDGGGFERAASLYRELVARAYGALHATGHGNDTILIGETAPKGDRSKGVKRAVVFKVFLRALYCVDRRYRPLKGKRARQLGCGRGGRDFRRRNPALFAATGYAHHPYELLLPPTFGPLLGDYGTIANLREITRALDRALRAHGSRRRLPLYLTEYGYQTNPPDQLGVKWSTQAAYLNQAEYLTWRNRRVRTLAQFLLVDDDLDVPASFQTGLVERGTLRRKPAYAAYRLPIWLPRSRVRRGARVKIWALLRPAPNGVRTPAEIQFRRRGTKKWRVVRRARSDTANYLRTSVRLRRGGHLRVRFQPPGMPRATSRAARVKVR